MVAKCVASNELYQDNMRYVRSENRLHLLSKSHYMQTWSSFNSSMIWTCWGTRPWRLILCFFSWIGFWIWSMTMRSSSPFRGGTILKRFTVITMILSPTSQSYRASALSFRKISETIFALPKRHSSSNIIDFIPQQSSCSGSQA